MVYERPFKRNRSDFMKLSVDEVFRKYADRIFSAAFSICRNQADADDVVQDTLIRYYSLNKDFESETHLKAWLLRVAINRVKDISASFWHRNKVSWEDYMEELPFQEPEDSRLFQAVMGLPAKYRAVIHLHYYEDYPVQDIARILGLPQGTVKSQLSRGRTLLKNSLQEEWDDDE